MAWEDRTRAEKRQARKEERERAKRDDSKTYIVSKPGVRYTVTGILSARVIAGKDGTIREKK